MLEEMQGFRLSPQQRHLWQLQQVNSLPYRCQCAVLIEGVIDIEILKQALEQVVNRHEILRTNFRCLPEMSIPLQVITNNNITWGENYDLSSYSHHQQEELLNSLLQKLNQQPFDFQYGCQLQLSIITLSSAKYILAICLPSLCADAASLNILVREISRSYAACLQGREPDNEPLQYADLAEWQNELLEGEDTEAGRDYWRKQNLAALTNFKLPWEQQITLQSTFQPQREAIAITSELLTQLEILAQQYNSSLLQVLLVCWQILIWRITQQSNVIVGINCDGRNYQELKDAIGLFAKYLPLNIKLEGERRFSEILSENRLEEIQKYQNYFTWENWEDREDLKYHYHFFPVCFEFLEAAAEYRVADIKFSVARQQSCIDKFKIKLTCQHQGQQLLAEFYYDSSLFNCEYIKILSRQFQNLLLSAIAHPEVPISKLEILTDIEKTATF